MSDTANDSEERIKRWDVPAIDGSDGKGFLTAGSLQDLQKSAYDEAYKAGHDEGLTSGGQEAARRAERLDQLLNALSRPFDELDESVEEQIVELSMTLVKKLFRREMQVNPDHVIGVVHEAIQLLPAASRNITVQLHPDDAKLLRESLSQSEGERAWRIAEDPLVSRGGCKVATDSSHIDAQAETRLRSLINSVFLDERQDG